VHPIHLLAVNLAQHSYFNLAGHDSGSTVLDHVVQIAGPHFTPVNDVQVRGGVVSVLWVAVARVCVRD
jgi:aldose 1-epimerase